MSGYVALRRDRLRSFATLQTKPGGERGIGPALPDRCATASGVPSPLPLVATSNPKVLISTLWSPLQRLRLEVAEREGFEPPEPFGSMVFKTTAFDRSAISPQTKTEVLVRSAGPVQVHIFAAALNKNLAVEAPILDRFE